MPKKLEDIKDAIMEGEVKEYKGRTKEQSAYAIATSKYKKMKGKHKKDHPKNLDELRAIAKRHKA